MGVKVKERDGAWWIYINHQGKRKAKRIGEGDAGKKAAKAAAEKIQAKLALGDVGIFESTTPAKVAPTFETLAWEWERLTSPRWKQGTVITYEGAIRHRLVPAFGRLPVNQITEGLIEGGRRLELRT